MFFHESSSAPDYVGVVYTSAKFAAGVTSISVNVGKYITAGDVDTVSKFFRIRRSSDSSTSAGPGSNPGLSPDAPMSWRSHY